ncbi:DUF5954 family protein [Microbispora sp. NPDC049633]|uniref:DUF5954 family protein n=1 Tax=Microbispora sp. NPDC049633 TaxID=3154355 RepID=UPI003414ACB9
MGYVIDQPIRYVAVRRYLAGNWQAISPQYATAKEAREDLASRLDDLADDWEDNNRQDQPDHMARAAASAVRNGFADHVTVGSIQFAVAKLASSLVLPRRVEDLEA